MIYVYGYERDARTSGGLTTYRKVSIFGKCTSQIFIAPGVKGFDVGFRNMIFKHEFMHAWHWSRGIGDVNFKLYSERATSNFSANYCNKLGYSDYQGVWDANFGVFPPSYGYKNFNSIIPTWIK